MIKDALDSAMSSPGRAMRQVLRSPRESLSLLRGNVYIPARPNAALDQLFSGTPISHDQIVSYLGELRTDDGIGRAHEKMAAVGGTEELHVVPRCLALYILVRHHQPETVVETGSYFGHSTLYILSALSRNGRGALHSFDAHPNEVGWFPDLPSDFELGYMVPDDLKDRWTLHRGDIRNTLEPVLEELGEIDLFFHDSDHSDSHKQFEFELAKTYLSPDGIVTSHDVGHGNGSEGAPATYAFVRLAESVGADIHPSREFEPGDDGNRVFAFCYLGE